MSNCYGILVSGDVTVIPNAIRKNRVSNIMQLSSMQLYKRGRFYYNTKKWDEAIESLSEVYDYLLGENNAKAADCLYMMAISTYMKNEYVIRESLYLKRSSCIGNRGTVIGWLQRTLRLL